MNVSTDEQGQPARDVAEAATATAAPSSPRVRRTVVLSDVHLSQAHPETDGDERWMRYRRRDRHPDPDLATLVDHLLADHGADEIELVFNGDVLDYDAPWVKDGKSSFDEFPLDERGCAEHTKRILDDHPVWIDASARLLVRGHRVMFMSGNHDIELVWPAVRVVVLAELVRRWQALWDEAEARGATLGLAPPGPDVTERVRFRAWFHVTEDGIYLEHGSQYDHLNGVRHAMLPFTRDRARIHPVFGKQAFKRTGSRMGYFNPYYEETFYMGLFGYLTHFLTHYARSDRHIFRTWAKGMVRTALEIWKHRHSEDWTEDVVRLAAAETGASREAILATHALGAVPGEDTMIPLLREAWLDRLALLLFLALVVLGASFLGGSRGALVAAGALVALFVIYEIVTPKPDLRTYDSAPPTVRRLWDIHGARAICMGHTHRPFGVWENGRFLGNSGAWCPAFRDWQCDEPVLDGRPFLMLWTDGRDIFGGLHWLRRGHVSADPEGAKLPDAGTKVVRSPT